jgi:hypothetical protein
MLDNGFTNDDVLYCLKNPETEINGKPLDLFTLTEEINTGEAITQYRKFFLKPGQG